MSVKQQVIIYAEKECYDCKGTGVLTVQWCGPDSIPYDKYKHLCQCIETRQLEPPSD